MIDLKYQADIVGFIRKLDKEHPYVFSFLISCLIVIYMFFFSPSFDASTEEINPTDNIQFVDIETSGPQKRIVKKDLSLKEGDPTEASDVDRAVGTSDDPTAVDISFYPNIAPPKPIGKFKKLYPKSAKEMNIEALVNIEILISASGRVMSVNILAIRLTKDIPSELHTVITRDFARDVRKILMDARFTPPVVEGKNVPVKMEMPIKFRLE